MPKSREKGHGVKGSGPPLREIAISAGMVLLWCWHC